MTISSATSPGPLIYGLFRPECYTEFFVHHNFLHIDCLKLLLSKFLSFGILLGAMFVKLPQILAIVRAKSTEGLAPAMYVLENVGYLIAVMYNLRHGYAFSTYGESAFLLVQGAILVFLFGYYNKRMMYVVIGIPLFLVFAYYMHSFATLSQLAFLQTSTIGIVASSRIPQIYSNYRLGSTGVLSIITVFMNVAGTSARIFTTLQEVNDPFVLLGTVSSFTFNLIIFLQVLWYWNATKAEKAQKTKKEGKKETKKAQ